MADETSGIEKLREYAKNRWTEDNLTGDVMKVWYGRYTTGEEFDALADQIEHEFHYAVDAAVNVTEESYRAQLTELSDRLMPEGLEWPRFEDGERVGFGSAVDGLDSPCEKFVFTRSMGGVCQIQDAGGNMVNVLNGERVKRPEPEVLAADGLPIKIGDTVYLESFGRPFTVVGFDGAYLKDANGGHLRADCATHTPPDTQERINEDTWKDATAYCQEYGVPVEYPKHAGKMKCEHLLRRQRELDARTMGGVK